MKPTGSRARIYNRDGALILDSDTFYSRGEVLRYDLPAPTTEEPDALKRAGPADAVLPGAPLIALEGVAFGYRPDRLVLRGVSLTVAEGQAMVKAARKYNRIVQTGSQRTNGYEFGIEGRVTPRWDIAGGYSYVISPETPSEVV